MNDRHIFRRRLAPVLLVLSLLLGACAAPTTNGATAPAGTGNVAPVPAPVTGDAGSTVTIDRSCSTNADCTIKNVGNCCGHYPACVNVDSPTDPEGVQAECAKKGMAGVCGFPAISSCQCVQGQCEGSSRVLLE